MTGKQKANIVRGALTVFVTGPIWFYLLYVLLSAANVDRLVWFLYIVYIPTGLLNTIIAAIVGDE